MSAISNIINKPADISVTNVNLRVMLAFVVGTTMHRADAWFESVIRTFFG